MGHSVDSELSPYSVLLRTFNSASTLAECLEGVALQAPAPTRVLLVDSGSSDATLAIAERHGVEVLHYPEAEKFHYSRSLNLGLAALTEPFVLILSSHTILKESTIAEQFLMELDRNSDVIGGYAVTRDWGAGICSRRVKFRITGTNFSGYNGLWNTCSMIRRAKWMQRPFSLQPWTAEDQEWAAHFFSQEPGSSTTRFEGLAVEDRNPRKSLWKHCSEFVSIATFSKPDLCKNSRCALLIFVSIARGLRGRRFRGELRVLKPLCLLLFRLKVLQFESNYHSGPPGFLRWLFHEAPSSKK